MDKSDKDHAIDPETSHLLKALVSPIILNLPSAGKVNIFCNCSERPILITWLHKRLICHIEQGSSVITICDLQNLGLPKNFEPVAKKDKWEMRKTEVEQFIFTHHWPIQPVGSIISVQLPVDDVSSEQVKANIIDLLQNGLLEIYHHRCNSSDFQLIGKLPTDFSREQSQVYLAFITWLSKKTHYYYFLEE